MAFAEIPCITTACSGFIEARNGASHNANGHKKCDFEGIRQSGDVLSGGICCKSGSISRYLPKL